MRKFAQSSHEYLIDQLQFVGNDSLQATDQGGTQTTQVKLNFNHPVKELVWVLQSDNRRGNAYENADAENPIQSAKIQFNGHDRFSARKGSYFNLVQCYQHHTNIPEDAGINVYSFALYPELEQPSGEIVFA